MSLIKIYKSGAQIDFVKESLTIRKENNSFISEFKVSHSSVPFLIVENAQTKRLLGSRDLTSINKPKVISVTVDEGGKLYYGELQILSYINGFRKCNLKYASDLLKIINRKISEFMPIVSVIPGETNPVPYSEASSELIPGFNNWRNYPVPFIIQNYPDVKWQFPTMNWPDKFGDNLEVDDDWYGWTKQINSFNGSLGQFMANDIDLSMPGIINTYHRNVPATQIYILSAFFYALSSIGFKLAGDFPNDDFIKRILFLSLKNNLTEVTVSDEENNISFGSANWTPGFDPGGDGDTYFKTTSQVAAVGNYKVKYKFKFASGHGYHPYITSLRIHSSGDDEGSYLFIKSVLITESIVEGEFDLSVNTPGSIIFIYQHKFQEMPLEYELTVRLGETAVFYEMHPTIELGRYLPDWTVGEMISNFKNLFNLKVTQDDFSKRLSLDFNEKQLLNTQKHLLTKSLAVTSYEQSEFNAYLLKYANEEDESLWIDSSGISVFANQQSDFVKKIDTKFKFIQNTGATVLINDFLQDKEGVGLIVYDKGTAPYVSEDYFEQNLKIKGPKGIYDVFWKKWLKFRLNAGVLEMSGPFTETELNKIIALNRVYIDHQDYFIVSSDYSETQQGFYSFKMRLESVNI